MKASPLLLTALLALPATAQSPCAIDAMVVFDGSASMAEIGFDTGATNRITDARAAMARVMPDVEKVRRIGLVTYGPGPEGSCGDHRRGDAGYGELVHCWGVPASTRFW